MKLVKGADGKQCDQLKTWKQLLLKCSEYKDNMVQHLAKLAQRFVAEDAAHARAVAAAGQPWVSLPDDEPMQAVIYLRLQARPSTFFYRRRERVLWTVLWVFNLTSVDSSQASRHPPFKGRCSAAPSTANHDMHRVQPWQMDTLNNLLCQSLLESISGDKPHCHSILAGTSDAAVQMREWSTHNVIPDDTVDATGDLVAYRLPWIALWRALSTFGAALSTMLQTARDDNVSLMGLANRWREQMDIVLPSFTGATPCDML